jgi:MFS family permease
VASNADRSRIFATAFLRAVGTGMTGVLAGLYLARLGLSAASAGFVISAGLGGAALASLFATTSADRFGRRRFLVVVSLFGAVGCLAMLASHALVAITLFAALGMLNGMGRDRGAALVIEQAIIPSTITDAERTKTFAWYNVLQDAGHALGSLMAALPSLAHHALGWDETFALRTGLGAAAGLTAAALAFYPRLSAAVEPAAPRERVKVSPDTKRILWRISSLFVLDSLGGGFLTASLVSWFFFQRFGVAEGSLGVLFFFARVLNALSHLGAAWLAKRIGLVKTMVFTHIPSSLFLVTVAFAPTFPIACVLFLLREGLVEMDVPTRQSYVMAVVKPEERTVASGVTHLVRIAMWAVGPAIAGWSMQTFSLGAPLGIAASLKIAYDVLLWGAFRNVRPPEERVTAA